MNNNTIGQFNYPIISALQNIQYMATKRQMIQYIYINEVTMTKECADFSWSNVNYIKMAFCVFHLILYSKATTNLLMFDDLAKPNLCKKIYQLI